MDIYSPSLHQDLYQKIIKRFSKYKPIQIITNILNEEDLDLVIEEIVNDIDSKKTPTEIETYESMEELNYPQGYEDNGINFLDDLNEKEMKDSRVQAMFERSRLNSLSIFIISQDYYELPKKTIRANGNICHIFKPNNFRDLQSHYQGKGSMDKSLNELIYLTSTCWDQK